MSAAVINAPTEPRQAVKTPAALRFFPSSRDVIFLLPWLLLLSLPAGISRLLGDGDTGWHLRTGEWILDHGAVPRQDLFSFTAAGQPWYAWEWLWDVCFGWLHRQAGLEGVVIATIALLSVSLLILYRECLRREPDFLISFALVFLAAGCSAIHWLARPHLYTMLFVLITAAVLDRAREGKVRLLAWLPVLTVVWANFHAGFFAAWTLLAAYAVGSAAEAFLDRRPIWPAARPYLLTWFGCLAASFVNPYGWQLHRHIWIYLTDSYHRDKIGEFQSVDFHTTAGAFFAGYIALAGMSLLWSLQKRRLAEALILTGWGWLALYSARNLPILVFVTGSDCCTGMRPNAAGSTGRAHAPFRPPSPLRRMAS
ncbi:MAG: hypothetical protein IPP47_28340 [Bryobacterales bacterium]|nr:hypothetical protein [Bryobacterales bacterium]